MGEFIDRDVATGNARERPLAFFEKLVHGRRSMETVASHSINPEDDLVGYEEALAAVTSHVARMPAIERPISEAVGHVVARDVEAMCSAPPADISLMDGFALACPGSSADVFEIAGAAAAGTPWGDRLAPGRAVEIMTGAWIPDGADRVVPFELAKVDGDTVAPTVMPARGANILARGADLAAGEIIAPAGRVVTPAMAQSLAAAGVSRVPVVDRPRVALIAVGDELVHPGEPSPSCRIHASNLVGTLAWLGRLGFRADTSVVGDDESLIARAIEAAVQDHDAVLTLGGAWRSRRDLVVPTLERMGWSRAFHGVRIAPGKSCAFGLLGDLPVFCLPGKPSSTEIAFLEIALPALASMAGRPGPVFPALRARYLGDPPRFRGTSWTTFLRGTLEVTHGEPIARVNLGDKRHDALSRTTCIIVIGEGEPAPAMGSDVLAQWILPDGLR